MHFSQLVPVKLGFIMYIFLTFEFTYLTLKTIYLLTTSVNAKYYP